MNDISDDNKLRFFQFKSSDTYSKWINNFKSWLSQQENKTECANSVLSYLIFLSDSYAASSLWTIYSILNKYMKVYCTTNLNDCVLIQDFLKQREKEHLVKKSKAFCHLKYRFLAEKKLINFSKWNVRRKI